MLGNKEHVHFQYSDSWHEKCGFVVLPEIIVVSINGWQWC